MTPEETLTLFSKGRDAWNAWANEMLAGRAELEAGRRWAVGWDEGLNDETRVWLEKARADFSAVHFGDGESRRPEPRPVGQPSSRAKKSGHLQLVSSNGVIMAAVTETKPPPPLRALADDVRRVPCDEVDFSGYSFPGDVDFRGALFLRTALFHGAHFFGDVSFAEARLSGRTDFSGAQFDGDALFHGTRFADAALFCDARVKGEAEFDKAEFSGDALFDRAQLYGSSRFHKTRFIKYADFFAVLFMGAASFNQAEFASMARFGHRQPWAPEGLSSAEFRSDADFNRCRFNDAADFVGTKFAAGANFRVVVCEREFLLAKASFASQVPDFISASFKNPPHMRGLSLDPSLPPGGFWRSIFGAPHHPELSARYRALRHMAGTAHEYAAEQKFRRNEIRSRRGGEDPFWRPSFFIGLAYDALSDFGASIVRPLLAWASSIVFFAYVYLSFGVIRPVNAPGLNWFARQWNLISGVITGDLICSAGGGFPPSEALYLSWKNALVVGLWSSVRNHEINACLYNATTGASAAPTAVSMLETAQAAWSAMLIALAALAISRSYRTK